MRNTAKCKWTIILLIQFLFITSVFAQYPVQVVVGLNPPYTLQTSEYYNSTTEKLFVLLTSTDLSKPQLRVHLSMSIQGQAATLKTRHDRYYPTLTLEPGLPLKISLSDLAPYFQSDNLDITGITRGQYQQSGKLPEGFYTFCFEARETATGQVVGKSSCAMAWISLSDPPFLNLPQRAESIPYSEVPNILFQWTPRHLNSPNSAFSTRYEFTLKELSDNGIAPEAAFSNSPPLYRTTTATTTLLYGPSEPALLPGKKYGWNIRAINTDQNNSDQFKNNGYSEINYFSYGSSCAPPFDVKSSVAQGRATLSWTDAIGSAPINNYTVQYREQGQDKYYSLNTSGPHAMLYDLKAGHHYLFRVGSLCSMDGTLAFSALQDLIMPGVQGSDNEACGILTPAITITNQQAIQTLLNGQVITAGDFPVKLESVSGQGTFSGSGYVTVPFLGQANVKVHFTGIKVNTEGQLTEGVIETTYNKSEEQLANLDQVIEGGAGVGMVRLGTDTTGYQVDFVIAGPQDITVTLDDNDNQAAADEQTGTITIKGENGQSKTISGQNLPVTIKDSGGNIYNIDKKGEVTKVGSMASLTQSAGQLDSLAIEKGTVRFIDYPEKQKYAFDPYRTTYRESQLYKEKYQELNPDYYVSAKAIAPAEVDVVRAVVELKDKSLNPDSIQYITARGQRFTSKPLGANTYEITIVGGPGGDAQELYGLYPKQDGSYISLGKLLVASYTTQRRKMILVPVNGAVADKEKIEKEINRIYNPVSVEWQVKKEENFDDQSWDLNKDGKLAISGSGLLSVLTPEMKALNEAYQKTHVIDKQAIYLFVLQAADSTLEGDMPRGKQFGYLFTDAAGRVAAHEAGHGLYLLKHVFDGYGFTKGELDDNLMDYPAGEHLTKYQWDQLHAPGLVIGVFEKDNDAAYAENNYIVTEKDRIFLTPAGTPLFLDKGSRIYSLNVDGNLWPDWALYSFEKNSGGSYSKISIGKTSLESGTFLGYLDYTNKDGENNFPYWVPNQGLQFHTGENTVTLIKKDAGDCRLKLYQVKMIFTEEQLKGYNNKERNEPKTSAAYQVGKNAIAVDSSNVLSTSSCTNLSELKTKEFFEKTTEGQTSAGGNGNLSGLLDYSEGKNSKPFFTEADKNKIGNVMLLLSQQLGIEVKGWLLNTGNPKYTEVYQAFNRDGAANKVLVILDEDRNEIRLEHQLKAPQWLLEIFPNGNADCVAAYVNQALDRLHQEAKYQVAAKAEQVLMEYGVALYKGIFGSLYCATSEEAVKGAPDGFKFFAGALHEVVATIDVAQIASGLVEMGKGFVSSTVDSYTSYFKDLKQTCTDLRQNNALPPGELVKRLMPPGIRQLQGAYDKLVKTAGHLSKFYFTGCGDMCAYRHGQVVVMIVPVIVTGGEWTVVKGEELLARLRTVGERTEEITKILAESETTAAEAVAISSEPEKITVKTENELGELEEAVVIEKKAGAVKITKAREVYQKGWRWALENDEWAKWSIESRNILKKQLSGLNKLGVDEAAHHKIPLECLKENEIVKDAVDEGFDFSGEVSDINGIGLKKVNEHTGGVGNNAKNHTKYNKIVEVYINSKKMEYLNLSSKQYIEQIVIPKINEFIIEARAKRMTIDDFAKFKKEL